MSSAERTGVDLATGGRREEVLAAARRLFAESSYGDVGIREIAAAAGVSAGLVMKYFGSKENLTRRAVDFDAFFADLVTGPAQDLGHRLVAAFAAIPPPPEGTNPLNVLLLMARSKDLPPGVRSALLDQFVERVRDALDGRDRQLRAELVCAQLLGVSAMRRTLQGPALLETGAAQLTAIIGPSLQRIIDAQDAAALAS